MSPKEQLVVIGGVAAGMSAASGAKRVKPGMEVLVFEKDSYISYGLCSVPYFISDDVKEFKDLISLTPEEAEIERGIRVFTCHEVLKIDVKEKSVLVKSRASGEELPIRFDKLVIATGGLPVKPPLPGIDLDHVFTIRTLDDGINIKKYIDRQGPSRAVIVGGGYIGMEMCESFRKRGLDVTVIERTDRVLGTMNSEIAEVVEKEIAAKGVIFHRETSVLGFNGKNGTVTGVVTDKGEFEADLALLCVGARPNSLLAKDAGLELGVSGAIRVDEFMKTSVPDIYAAGDCAEAIHLVTGKKVYVPLGTTANKQGRVAGENAAGAGKVFDGIVGTAVTKVFDLEVARTGLSAMEAEREGLAHFTSTIQGRSRSSAYPAGKPIIVSYIVEQGTGRLLGAQMVGKEGVAHRIDTLAACLHARMTVEDVSRLDLAYAPPFATVWDPILIAAHVAANQIKKGG